MISTVFLFGLILVLIFVLPGKYMLLSSLYISICILIWDNDKKRVNWANRLVFVVNTIICILFYLAGINNFVPYIGSVFYSAIMLLALLTALIKKPFTLTKKSNELNELKFHLIYCYFMAIMNMFALVLSLILMPNVLYIVMPLLLSFLSVVLGPTVAKYMLQVKNERGVTNE